MSRSESRNLNQDQAQSEEYEQALAEYQKAVQAIEAAGESVSVEQIEAAINARDRIHQILAEEHPAYTQSLTQAFASVLKSLLDLLKKCGRVFLVSVHFLVSMLSGQSQQAQRKLNRVRQIDESLRTRSRQIRRVVKVQRVVPLSDLREVLDQPSRPQWLRLFKSGKSWHDRYDWLWRGISLVCFIWAIALLVDTVNRFLTGGVSTGGVAAILGTVFLTLLSSGGVLTSFGQGELEKVFESFEIPKKWWDEWRCLLSVATLSLLIVLRIYGLPVASTCYARTPQSGFLLDLRHCFGETPALTQAAVSNQKVKVQESRYQRAIALNPDNFEAYFNLAVLYEQEMDYDEALKTYQIASRIGNDTEQQQAEMGLIRMLIKKEDLKSADERLTAYLEEFDSQKIDDAQFEAIKQLGEAYLDQGRQDQKALRELQTYLRQNSGQSSAPSVSNQPVSDDNLAAAVNWFEKGVQKTEKDETETGLLKNYQMQVFLALAKWEQVDWSSMLSSVKDAMKVEKKLSHKEPSILLACMKTYAMAVSQPSNTQSEEFRQTSGQCAAGNPASEEEFASLAKQLQQLNQQFQPF